MSSNRREVKNRVICDSFFRRHKWNNPHEPEKGDIFRKCLRCGQVQQSIRDVDALGEGFWKWVNKENVVTVSLLDIIENHEGKPFSVNMEGA